MVEIHNICKLKNSHWNYSFKSNLAWFKKNIKSYDIHNLVYYNSKLIGYTLLRIRTFLNKSKTNSVGISGLSGNMIEAEITNKELGLVGEIKTFTEFFNSYPSQIQFLSNSYKKNFDTSWRFRIWQY